MSKIAVVGAGQAGLLAAHALLRQGHEVTLHSDKTPEDFMTKARPTGAAVRYDNSLNFERDLGLEHWGDVAPQGDSVHLHYSEEKGNVLLTLLGRLEKHNLAIDVRLQSATWMRELDERGGQVEIEEVTLERLDEIAAANDLTIVAAGRGDIHKLFKRDDARSVYDKPQRRLANVAVTGIPMHFDYAPWLLPVKFNFFAPDGEMFWCPWFSKDGDQSWSLIFEWKEGGGFTFEDVTSGDECLQRAKDVIQEFSPWDYEWVKDAVICDENAWIKGGFTPEVRDVVGTLPSGRAVMALGDTAHSLDPIGGQGANNGNKMAKAWTEAIAERPEGPFDADWMRSVNDAFWERNKYTPMLNNALLEPLPPAGEMLVTAQYGSTGKPDDDSPAQKIANLYVNSFNDPIVIAEALQDEALARKIIADAFGGDDQVDAALEAAHHAIDDAQARQAAGEPAGHPGT